jgi:uncharacterized membrane protein
MRLLPVTSMARRLVLILGLLAAVFAVYALYMAIAKAHLLDAQCAPNLWDVLDECSAPQDWMTRFYLLGGACLLLLLSAFVGWVQSVGQEQPS